MVVFIDEFVDIAEKFLALLALSCSTLRCLLFADFLGLALPDMAQSGAIRLLLPPSREETSVTDFVGEDNDDLGD